MSDHRTHQDIEHKPRRDTYAELRERASKAKVEMPWPVLPPDQQPTAGMRGTYRRATKRGNAMRTLRVKFKVEPRDPETGEVNGEAQVMTSKFVQALPVRGWEPVRATRRRRAKAARRSRAVTSRRR